MKYLKKSRFVFIIINASIFGNYKKKIIIDIYIYDIISVIKKL